MSSESSTATQSGGIGFLGLLTIVFIVLKLTHYIDWSWWWVLSPLYVIPAILVIVFVAMMVAAFTIAFRD